MAIAAIEEALLPLYRFDGLHHECALLHHGTACACISHAEWLPSWCSV